MSALERITRIEDELQKTGVFVGDNVPPLPDERTKKIAFLLSAVQAYRKIAIEYQRRYEYMKMHLDQFRDSVDEVEIIKRLDGEFEQQMSRQSVES